MQLHEQYRPSSFAEVVGQEEAVKRIGAIIQRGLAGRAYWISGGSGTGKTTIAKIIAAEVADTLAIEELDAADLTPKRVAEIERQCSMRPLGKRHGWAFIVNESHGLRRDTIRQLLVALERIMPHVVWVFTTTNEGQASLFEDCEDTAPLLSRCILLRLRKLSDLDCATRARHVAQAAKMDGKPLADYLGLAKRCECNLRAMFQAIESGELL